MNPITMSEPQYPIRVYLQEESDHFLNMSKLYKHHILGKWTYIMFPNEEELLSFKLAFGDMYEPLNGWACEMEHYMNCEKWPEEIMNKYI